MEFSSDSDTVWSILKGDLQVVLALTNMDTLFLEKVVAILRSVFCNNQKGIISKSSVFDQHTRFPFSLATLFLGTK